MFWINNLITTIGKIEGAMSKHFNNDFLMFGTMFNYIIMRSIGVI